MYNCCERDRIMDMVRAYSFAAYDASLYLDANPYCREAICYFNKYKKLHEEALKAYECRFGPLTHGASMDTDKWTWVEGPWPWELEG